MQIRKIRDFLRLEAAGRGAERGMTLIEIMVVITIIGLIMGMVGVAVMKQLESAKKMTACNQIKEFEQALELYKLEKNQYPGTEEGLSALVTAKKLKGNSVPKDPWGKDYVYIFPGQHNSDGFDMQSYGPTGQQGGGAGAEQITNWGPPCVK
ncbi:MAG: type II secretion system major pseudopilin GspG [Myxococcota bacterium]|jgi:general secretion pathway protein G